MRKLHRALRRAFAVAAYGSLSISFAATAADDGGSDTLEQVVVTGSRIKQNEFDAPTPTVSINAASLEAAGTTNLTDYLTHQPALTGSYDSTQTTGNGPQAFIGATGLNLLNLRNLGVERTLVLVDGRRHVSQLPETAAVDVNTIPQDLIERIDIVTGGVSAVYGADAVSGVVNFVMKKHFEGLTARMQYGQATAGQPTNWQGSITGGFDFADGRGNLAGSVEHTSEGRLRSTDRKYLRRDKFTLLERNPDDPTDDPNVPDYVPFRDVRFYDSSREGGIDLDFDGVPDVRPNGSPYQIDRFIDPFFTAGGSGTPLADEIGDLLPTSETTVTSAFLNFKINDVANFFAEAKFVRGRALAASQPTYDYYLFLTADNPYIPAAVRSQIIPGAAGANLTGDPTTPDGFFVNRDNFDLGVREEDITRETFRAVTGVNGDLDSGLHYEVSYVYGQTDVRQISINNRYSDRFLAAIDVVTDPSTGRPTCRSNLDPTALPFQPAQGFDFSGRLSFTPGPNSGCLPLNILGEGVADPAAIDWIMENSRSTSRLTQNVFNAYVSGPLPWLQLPGGPIDAVLGIEWRRETSRSTPPLEDQEGLTFGNVLQPVAGSFDVKEAFTELRLPLLKDVPFAKLLQFSAALRVSDYSTVGDTTTWNVGTVWAPIRDVSFRSTVAQSVRAPNISELYSPNGQTFLGIHDPCDVSALNNGSPYRAANCAAVLTALGIDPTTYHDPNSGSIPGSQGGNPHLTEETSKSYTFGTVIRPRFATGLAIAVDYYDIKIKNAINTASAQQVAENCVDQPTLDNVFCHSLTRDPSTGGVDSFVLTPENVAAFRTRGIDFNVNYSIDPARFGVDPDIGLFNIALVGNRLDKLTQVPSPGADPLDLRTTQYAPKWQSTLDITWAFHALRVNYGLNYFSKTTRFDLTTLAGDPDSASRANIYFNARKTHDLSASYDFDGGYHVYAGVNNLTDQKPDLDTIYPVSPLGRFVYAGLKVDFGKL